MKKIDRLGWAAGISFISYGVRVGVRTNRPEVLDRLAERLPPGWKPAHSPVVDMLYSFLVGGEGARPGVRRYNVVYADIFKLARTMDIDEALDKLESDIQLHVAEFSTSRIFVHSGVVGWKGRAILIPGRSYSGKSTLVAELVRAGAEYYSDEYAVLDSRGRVHPYPRPLGVRDNPVELPKKHSVESLGGRAGSKPLPVGMVIASHYRPGAKWRPRRLSSGQGVLTLLRNTVPAQRQPDLALSTLRQAVSDALILKGPRGDVAETVDTILRRLDQWSGDYKN